MKGQRRVQSFTLIELLVVIAIIAILAAVLTPAVTDALTRGKMTGTMNNGRSIYLSLFSRDTEDPVFQSGSPYPKSTATDPMYFDTSTKFFVWVVTSGVMTVDFSFFSAPGISPYKGTTPSGFTDLNNAWCITADASSATPDGAALLFTRNLVIDKLNDPLATALSDNEPFGKKGVVVVTKGGSSMVLKQSYLTNNFNAAGVSNIVIRPKAAGQW
ncbi:MAG: prepilin-type N-terminal cleavage/methylation domain-containing protein [Verrucomicrobiota bacterium]